MVSGLLTLVIFKKRFDNVAFFQHYRLPSECRSITNNKRFIEFMEPLDENSGPIEMILSYLPEFMNISSRNRFIYINIGAGELVNSSISEMFKPFYPMEPRAFNIYVVDHNTSVLSSYVKNPIVTFVYHSGLAGDKAITSLSSDDDDYLSAPLDEEEFDFIRWLKRTVSDKDFVILMMNARAVELKILFELFESGAICHVDELFLGCSDVADRTSAMCGDCASFFRGLRKSGVFVHRWLGN